MKEIERIIKRCVDTSYHELFPSELKEITKAIEQYVIKAIPKDIQHPTELYTDIIQKYDASTAFVTGYKACIAELKKGLK